MSEQSKRYDDVARLLEAANLEGVHYHEFGRHARPRPAPEPEVRPPEAVPEPVKASAEAPRSEFAPWQRQSAASQRADVPPTQEVASSTSSFTKSTEDKAPSPERASTATEPPAAPTAEKMRRSLRPVAASASAESAQYSPRESLGATFSRLIARAPERPPPKLDLGLDDLPPREPVSVDAGRRDERLKSLFARLKGPGRDDGRARG